MIKYLIAALGAGTVFFSAAAAEARCVGTGYGFVQVIACADADAGLDGTTVAPRVAFSCSTGALSTPPCDGLIRLEEIAIDMTGFVPNPSFPPPCVDTERGTVRTAAGTLGTLYVDGQATPVNVSSFFVGDPQGC